VKWGDSWKKYVGLLINCKRWMSVKGIDTEKIIPKKELQKIVEKAPLYHKPLGPMMWIG